MQLASAGLLPKLVGAVLITGFVYLVWPRVWELHLENAAGLTH
jgi:uncharacterized membrane protein YccC